MVKHPVAIYLRSKGGDVEIKQEDLEQDFAKFTLAQEGSDVKRLYDKKTKQPLSVRGEFGGMGDVIPHFYDRVEGVPRDGQRREFLNRDASSTAHGNRIDDLVRVLNGLQRCELVIEPFHQPRETLAELIDYHWSTEAARSITSTASVRHDVFGQANSNWMTVGQPTVAIEVIDSHWPEEQSLAAMIEHSVHTPALIIFDLIGSRLCRLDEKEETLLALFYIQNGEIKKDGRPLGTKVMANGKPTSRKVTTSLDLESEMKQAKARFSKTQIKSDR